MGCGVLIDVNELVRQLEKASPNGVATLDSNTKVPKVQINGVLSAADVGAIAPTDLLNWENIINFPSPIDFLNVNQAPPNWNYWLFGNFYGQYWELVPVSQNPVNNTVALRTSTGGIVGTTLSATVTTPSTSPTTGASVVAGGQGIGGNQHVGGFTSLGGTAGGHPAIKIKVFEGTTAADEGEQSSLLHLVTSSKIISVSAIVEYSTGNFISSGNQFTPGYQFSISIGTSTIAIGNQFGNSGSILSKPFVITMFYKE